MKKPEQQEIYRTESSKRSRSASPTFALKLTAWVLGLSLSGCALYPQSASKSVVKECVLPADQVGTVSGIWPVIPVPIALQQGAFDAVETTEITKAASTWNDFYGSSLSIQVLDSGEGSTRVSSSNNPAQAGSLCALGIVPGKEFIGNVVIYKLNPWPTKYAANAIALTSFCVLPQKPFSRMYMATMEVNYQRFFTQGNKLPDLQSIILHELGHLLGLNHSCEASQKAGTPNCNDPNINPEYVAASMYPVFGFSQDGLGEVKQSLGRNDQGRANCLYKSTAQ